MAEGLESQQAIALRYQSQQLFNTAEEEAELWFENKRFKDRVKRLARSRSRVQCSSVSCVVMARRIKGS
jgi:hypothetical protein